MSLFKRNIWLLYIVLLIVGLMICIPLITRTYRVHLNEVVVKQQNRINLVEISLNSVLRNQGQILDLISDNVLRTDLSTEQVTTLPIFESLLKTNESVIAYGLISPAGRYLYFSNNADLNLLPNLLEQEESRDTFIQTLESDRLILGRTYYFAPLSTMVIPLRKRITNDKGEVVAVITAALILETTSDFFSNRLHFGENDALAIIRDFDHFSQYRSTTQNLGSPYFEPLSDELWNRVFDIVEKKYGLTYSEAKDSNLFFNYTTIDRWGIPSIMTMNYNSDYDQWIVSDIKRSVFLHDFLSSASVIMTVYLIMAVLLFFLTRSIYNSERKKHEALILQANYDNLTGLPNRNYLNNKKEYWINKTASPFSLLYLDIDNFKYVSDSFGDEFGEELLVQFSTRLMIKLPEDAEIIHMERDEYYVLLRDNTLTGHSELDKGVLDSLNEFVEDLLIVMSQPYNIRDFYITIGVSIGIVRYPEHGNSLNELNRAAGITMQAVKKQKHCAKLYSNSMERGYFRKIDIKNELINAIQENELYMVYQPQIDRDGNLYGVEALVRWDNKKLGNVSPQEFIEVAEASGLINPIGDFITSTALKEIGEVQRATDISFNISINISVKQFMRENFIDLLFMQIDQFRIKSLSVTLEITENLFIEDLEYLIPILQKINEYGIHVSLDDFGTGYSSLSILRNLPVHELKIDKSFIDRICDEKKDLQMVKNIIAIAKNLDCVIVAEGVETKEQVDILHSQECDFIQGYYYSKPLKKIDLIQFIDTRTDNELPPEGNSAILESI